MSRILNRPLRMMKETFLPLSFDENHFEMDWSMEPGGFVPPHMHAHKDEHFTVTKGEVLFTVGDKTVVKKTGDTLMVTKGMLHSIANKTKEQIGLRVRYTPCADTEKFFQALNYFSSDGEVSMSAMLKVFYVQEKLGWKKFSEAADAGGTVMFGMLKILANVFGLIFGWSKYLRNF